MDLAGPPLQHPDVLHQAPTGLPAQVHHDLDRAGELGVHGGDGHARQRSQRLEPGHHLRGRVRVHGAGTTLVAGVERGEELTDLCPADLPHHQTVRTHPQ